MFLSVTAVLSSGPFAPTALGDGRYGTDANMSPSLNMPAINFCLMTVSEESIL